MAVRASPAVDAARRSAWRTTSSGPPTGAPAASAEASRAVSAFAQRVIAWQRAHGRHDLPWQASRDPYRIWLSEVMLQQTQVATVIPYYQRFLAAFPDVASLAAAPAEQVLALWSGLGYYSRARHLHRAANEVMTRFGGSMPTDPEALASLPGIGRSTAAAIAVFSVGERAAILDGNVKRVFLRHGAIDGDPGSGAVLAQLWALAQARLPASDLPAYTQGLMDLGATVCTRSRPACGRCPLAVDCRALASARPTDWPQPRRRPAAPRRDLPLLLIRRGDAVLLQRRPERGIWGGLWCPPVCDRPPASAAEAIAAAADLLVALGEADAGAACAGGATVRALTVFEHALTHFRLVIAPWQVDLPVASAPAATGAAALIDCRWWPLRDCADAALPVPARRLLAGLAPDASSPGEP
ncbi:MAG: A/G-specific adenine glycosylase [Betaproteobacteria bacterium]|nr:A/G-specific adenine glycosylase [Betaproteobacteria bacterium]